MKKLLLAVAVVTSMTSVTTAQAAPTLYGKAHLSLDNVDNGDNEVQLNSNASRIGVKGEESLTERLSVIYQAEWGVSTDEGGNSDLSARNRYLGLKVPNVGSLKAGYYDSNFKTTAGKQQDIYNDHLLDITNTMYGEDRLKNVIGFESDPSLLGGLQVKTQIQAGENDQTDYTTEERDSLNGVSASLGYSNKDYGVSAQVAGNLGVVGKYNGISDVKVESDAIRVAGSLDLGKAGIDGLTVGALWQTAEPSDSPSAATLTANSLDPRVASLKEDAWLVATSYAIPNSNWKLKAQYQNAETEWNGGSTSVDQYGLGLDYALNKKTRAYGVLAQQDWDNRADKITVVGAGIEFNF